MPSQASRQAPREPGRQKTKVVPISPAVARRCHVSRCNLQHFLGLGKASVAAPQGVEAPGAAAGEGEIEEDEAVERRQLAVVDDGKEAAGGMG